MKIGHEGLDLIKKFEGLSLDVYDDVIGLKTVGYGHLIKEGEDFGKSISQEQADELLRRDVQTVEKCVTSLVRHPISQNEFDALCSFTFNLGCRALQSSTLLKLINVGDIEGAAEQFLRWNRAGGNVVKGLTNRRIAERALFLGVS